MANRFRLGPSGLCICPKCGYKTVHQRGTPCQEMKCPNCAVKLLREGAYHHQLFEKKKERLDSKE